MGKSEIIYFDDSGKIVDKENATKVIIRELDENNNLINEVFGVVNHTSTDISKEAK